MRRIPIAFASLTLVGSLVAMTTDVAVIGGGSAGFAAAWSAAHLGSSVVLVEREKMLGGTSTFAGVNNWESGMGGTGLPYRVYQRLEKIPNAAGVYVFDRHCMWKKPSEPYAFPGGLLKIDKSLPYSKSLLRHGPGMGKEAWFRENCHGVIFEPTCMARVMEDMLQETGRCTTLTNVSFVQADAQNGRVRSVTLSDGRRLEAKLFIDATDGVLCRQLGCTMMFGRDARTAFNEPGAPETPFPNLNGATLMFRITPTATPGVEPLPADIPERSWWGRFPLVFATTYPNGDIGLNMLPTMRGEEAVALGAEAAYAECRRRVYAEWHWLQTTYAEFRNYRLLSIAPVLAYRETCRVRGEYVLNQNDLIAGLSKQTHPDIIAIADHPMDNHGGGGPSGELKEEYGIPYRCLLPLGTENVLIAGRAASFSAIAASSCRLSRTMMQLGEAAGVAAHLATTRGISLRNVDAAEIRQFMHNCIDGSP
ncbi:MAG: FAD-dependent oxidoreductase [bacterium]|nr:FAD-dependent oxidoreductase [bacterium]